MSLYEDKDLLAFQDNIQYKLAHWQKKMFPNTKKGHPSRGIAEEFGETAEMLMNFLVAARGIGKIHQAYLKNSQGIRKMTLQKMKEQIADGIADILIFAVQECSNQELDMLELYRGVALEVMRRDWKKNPTTGKSKKKKKA